MKYYWVYMIVFIALKLFEVIDISWWWLVIPYVLYWLAYLFGILLAIGIVCYVFGKAYKKAKK